MTEAAPTRPMTKGEREDLLRLIKQRERVAKTAAEQRSAAMLADFERKVCDMDTFARKEVWGAATEAVIEAATKANEQIDAKAAELGIPAEFRPSIKFSWDRQCDQVYEGKRNEMRRVAKVEIAALEKVARLQIEQESVRAQAEVLAHGLSSAAAIEFLNNLPALESMMPALDVTAIQAKLAEQVRTMGGYRGPRLIT